MSFLQDLYNGKAKFGSNPLANMPGANIFLKNYNLPNNGGSYSAVGGTQVPVPTAGPMVNLPAAPVKPIFSGSNPPAPVQTAPVAPTRSKYMNPQTGTYFTPQEYANYVATKIPASKQMGDVTKYAGDAIMNQNQTSEQLQSTARNLNNARNDIAVGATDPYDITQGGEIVYSPEEREAIKKAYAGIYDPALNDVFSKLEKKQKEDTLKASQEFEMTKLQKQHEYAMAEKGLTGSGTGLGGEYVKGANPAVDAWAQRIFDGTAKITDIPAAQKGMRDAVVVALQASGNDLAGRPTVTELGKQAAASAAELMRKFTAGEGTSAVGTSRFFSGGSLSIAGTDKADFVIDFQNLKDQLSLEGVKYLKGQGQVSDAERALLANAVTKLNLRQSEEDFKSTLQGIIDRLSGVTAGKMISPDGTQEVNIADLTPEQIKEAQDAGWK